MMVIALLALSLDRKLDFIDGTAVGFTGKDPYVWVNCFTESGKAVMLNCQCIINRQGDWIVSVEEGPRAKSTYILKVNPPLYLVRKYKVAIPSRGRPVLAIDKTDFVFGDLNEDNRIDKRDLKWVQEAVGVKKGDPHWTEDMGWNSSMEAGKFFDFNHDDVVDDKDLAVIRANLGRVGE